MPPVKLGIVMDPITSINIKKDSSFALLLEAQQRGWELYYMEVKDLYLRDGITYANVHRLQVQRDPSGWYAFTSELRGLQLDLLDVLLMRKDPPFNQEYIYATYLLEVAERRGLYVVNRPSALRDANEKLYTVWFHQCCPPTLVSRNKKQLREFLIEQGEIVLKPLDGMGGASIFHVRQDDPNTSVILELMTEHENRFIMAQRYLPEIRNGDKRILIIDGKPVPYALARIPAEGETRGNLAAGGRAEGREMSDQDRWICEQVGPTLHEKGLVFVGIDVIGDHLTEINVTSPTGIQELDRAYNLNISAQLMDHIADRVA